MSHDFNLFPSCVHDKLFKTQRGDLCLCLHEAWPLLLADFNLLGPIKLILKSELMVLASFCCQLDFMPVPGSTEMLDLTSGLCLETLNLGAVIAGQEVETENLSFHFFDRNGEELFKVLLFPDSDVDGFIQLVSHYAKHPRILQMKSSLPRQARDKRVLLKEEQANLQKTWAAFDPTLGDDLLPGRGEISWLQALRCVGEERAMFLSRVGLIKAMLAAHQHQLRLQIIVYEEGFHQERIFVPKRIERCGQCLHLLDVETEAHFFLEANSEIWVGFHGRARTPVIHIFSGLKKCRRIIQFAGQGDEAEVWHRALWVSAHILS